MTGQHFDYYYMYAYVYVLPIYVCRCMPSIIVHDVYVIQGSTVKILIGNMSWNMHIENFYSCLIFVFKYQVSVRTL